MPGDAILTARLHLSRFGPGDAGLIADLDADPAVVRYVYLGPFAAPPADRYAAEVLPKFLADYGPAFGSWKVRPLFDNRPGPFAGWVFVRPVGAAKWFPPVAGQVDLDPRTPELGTGSRGGSGAAGSPPRRPGLCRAGPRRTASRPPARSATRRTPGAAG